jgi:FkbM family methyltransferase
LALFVRDASAEEQPFQVSLTAFGRQATARIDRFSDYFTLFELFVQNDYRFDEDHTPNVILDLGSNVGYSLLYFRLQYPAARLIGFEPDPYNFEQLKQQADLLENVKVFPIAASGGSGKISFFADPHRGQSSSSFRRRERQQEVHVEARTLDSLLNLAGSDVVDLLKFDIEGAEMDVFRTFTRWTTVHRFVGELHTDTGDWDLKDFTALFERTHEIELRELSPHRYMMVARQKVDHTG